MLGLSWVPAAARQGHGAGRGLLKQLVEAYTCQEMPPLAKMPLGKPYFPGKSLHFSISHSKKTVFCALSDRPIGIDAEELTRTIDPRLAEKILSAAEYAQYQAAEDRNRALLTFWVLKEAAAKCSGRGLQGYPNHTDFSLTDPRVFQLGGCLVAVIEEDDYVI